MKTTEIVRSVCRPISIIIVTVTVCYMHSQEMPVPDSLNWVWQIMMAWWFGEKTISKVSGGYTSALLKAVKKEE